MSLEANGGEEILAAAATEDAPKKVVLSGCLLLYLRLHKASQNLA